MRLGPITLRLSREPERNLEPKAAALPFLAFGLDRAAHHLDVPTGDRQPNAGSGKAAGSGFLLLAERIKNPLARLWREADAGVLHLDGQPDFRGGPSEEVDRTG